MTVIRYNPDSKSVRELNRKLLSFLEFSPRDHVRLSRDTDIVVGMNPANKGIVV